MAVSGENLRKSDHEGTAVAPQHNHGGGDAPDHVHHHHGHQPHAVANQTSRSQEKVEEYSSGELSSSELQHFLENKESSGIMNFRCFSKSLSVCRHTVSEASKPPAGARMMGPKGPEILVKHKT